MIYPISAESACSMHAPHPKHSNMQILMCQIWRVKIASNQMFECNRKWKSQFHTTFNIDIIRYANICLVPSHKHSNTRVHKPRPRTPDVHTRSVSAAAAFPNANPYSYTIDRTWRITSVLVLPILRSCLCNMHDIYERYDEKNLAHLHPFFSPLLCIHSVPSNET